jgi:hypothetical protein
MKLGDQSLSFLEKERYVLDNIETILNELRNGDLSKEDKLVLCDVAEKNNEPSILEELALFKGVSRVFADELMKNDKHGITHRIINDIKGSEIQCEADKRDLINKILETPNLLHLLIKALFSFVFVESIASMMGKKLFGKKPLR